MRSFSYDILIKYTTISIRKLVLMQNVKSNYTVLNTFILYEINIYFLLIDLI